MLSIGRFGKDSQSWGFLHNLYHRVFMYVPENIQIQKQTGVLSSFAGFPPTLKAKSCFQIYKTEDVIMSTSITTNPVLSPGSTYIGFLGEAVYTPEDQTYTWASTNIWSSYVSNSTWYMFCYGAEDVSSTSLGKAGIGFATTIDFSYNTVYGGIPYSTDGYRALAKFNVNTTGQAITNLGIFENDVEYVGNIKSSIANSTAGQTSTSVQYRCMEGSPIGSHTNTGIRFLVNFETTLLPNDIITLQLLSNQSTHWVDVYNACSLVIVGFFPAYLNTNKGLGIMPWSSNSYMVQFDVPGNMVDGTTLAWSSVTGSTYGYSRWRVRKARC